LSPMGTARDPVTRAANANLIARSAAPERDPLESGSRDGAGSGSSVDDADCTGLPGWFREEK
jgi:hypothetical protein